MSTGEHAERPVEALREAAAELERARERVAEFGEGELERLREAHEEFTRLLDRYEEPATGDGDFETFIEFQGRIETTVERLDEDLLLYETFEECDQHLQQRRLSTSDFEHVRTQLEPVADLTARLDERERCREAYQRARTRVRERLRETERRIEELEELRRLGEADLEAPIERLREPISTYDERATEAFESFRRSAPAREVISVLETSRLFPLVGFDPVPEALSEYVRTRPPGEEPIPTLLEYAGYSRSKLDHYVADPDALKRVVGRNETFLEWLDAEPLTVGWPPPPADRLRYRCRELTSVLNRFAPEVVESLRAVAELPRETDYGRLRESAVAREELTETQRDRLASGAVADELEEARARRERLRAALEEVG